MFYSREETKTTTESQCQHVVQCPFYPAWYSKEGVPLGERAAAAVKESAIQYWLFADQKADLSDPEFEELKNTEEVTNYRPPRKKTRSKHTRFASRSSRTSRK